MLINRREKKSDDDGHEDDVETIGDISSKKDDKKEGKSVLFDEGKDEHASSNKESKDNKK